MDTNYVALWLHEKYLTHEQRQTSPLPFPTNLIQVIMLFTSWKKWKHILNDKECWQQNIKSLYGIDTSFVHVCRSDQFSFFFLEELHWIHLWNKVEIHLIYFTLEITYIIYQLTIFTLLYDLYMYPCKLIFSKADNS